MDLDVTTLLQAAAERGRAADDEGVRALVVLHGRHKVLKVGANASIGICRHDERVAFALEHFLGCRAGRVNDGDDFQAGTELDV